MVLGSHVTFLDNSIDDEYNNPQRSLMCTKCLACMVCINSIDNEYNKSYLIHPEIHIMMFWAFGLWSLVEEEQTCS